MVESLPLDKLPCSFVEMKSPLHFPRCVVVNGAPSTGSSSLSKEIADKLDFRFFDTGRLIRKASRIWCNGSWEDFLRHHKDEFYALTVKRIHDEPKYVVEGRLVGIQAENANNVLRILCTANWETKLERFRDKECLQTLTDEEIEGKYRERLDRDKAILEGIWGYPLSRLFDPKLYDVIVDTTNLNSVEITREIITRLV